MTANLRKALFAAIPIVVTAIAAWGYITQDQAALLGTTLTATVGFAWTLSRATGHRLLDAGVRRALYALIIAAIATAGGWAAFDVALVTSIIMAGVGAVLAIWNVDPDERMDVGDGLDILDGRDGESPRRAMRVAVLFAGLILVMSSLVATAQPAQAAAGCWGMKVERWWGTYGESRCLHGKVKSHRVRIVCRDGSTLVGPWRKPGDYSSALCWGQSTRSITVDKSY